MGTGMGEAARQAIPGSLRRVSIFRDLSEDELTNLARQVVRRPCARQELIFSQGERGDGLYIVQRGHVSISRQSFSGDELILSVVDPGEYFGEMALFDDEPRSASATAVEVSVLLFLSRAAFREFIHAHPAAVFACLSVIVGHLRRTTDLADEIALLDIKSRLARRLVRLVRDGSVDGAGRELPPTSFRITQQHLASMLGATRESVNKHLNAFADDGILRLQRGRIHILDLERLEEHAGWM